MSSTAERTDGRSAPTARITTASVATGNHAARQVGDIETRDSLASTPTRTSDSRCRAPPVETTLPAPATFGPNSSAWWTRGRPARLMRNTNCSRPDGSPERPSETSSTTRQVAVSSRSTTVVIVWSEPTTETVGSPIQSRCASIPIVHFIDIADGAPVGPGSARVAATVPMSARAPASTAMFSESSSPPTGAAADAATRIRSPHCRILNGGSECADRSVDLRVPSPPATTIEPCAFTSSAPRSAH